MHLEQHPQERNPAESDVRSTIHNWLIGEVHNLGGRETPKNQISDDWKLNLNPAQLAALRSHFAIRFGDAPFDETWATLTIGDAAAAIEETLKRHRHTPAEEQLPRAA